MNVRWLPARITGPSPGMCSTPSTRGRYIRRTIGPSTALMSAKRDNGPSGRVRRTPARYRACVRISPRKRTILPSGDPAQLGSPSSIRSVDMRFRHVPSEVARTQAAPAYDSRGVRRTHRTPGTPVTPGTHRTQGALMTDDQQHGPDSTRRRQARGWAAGPSSGPRPSGPASPSSAWARTPPPRPPGRRLDPLDQLPVPAVIGAPRRQRLPPRAHLRLLPARPGHRRGRHRAGPRPHQGRPPGVPSRERDISTPCLMTNCCSGLRSTAVN